MFCVSYYDVTKQNKQTKRRNYPKDVLHEAEFGKSNNNDTFNACSQGFAKMPFCAIFQSMWPFLFPIVSMSIFGH